MKNILRVFTENNHRFIALFVVFIMLFNACGNLLVDDFNPNNTNNSTNPNYSPFAFYVDENGNFTETDLGRTVMVADEDILDVVFYSDDASTYQRVGITYWGNTITYLFEDNHDFPLSMLLTDSEESFNGFFTPYDPVTQTYSLTFEEGDLKETWPDITLSKDIFTQYTDDPELTPSQNQRLRNLYISMCIYLSLDNFISLDGTDQARFIKRFIFREYFLSVLFRNLQTSTSSRKISAYTFFPFFPE